MNGAALILPPLSLSLSHILHPAMIPSFFPFPSSFVSISHTVSLVPHSVKEKNTHKKKKTQVIRSIFGLYEQLEKLLWCYEVIWFSGSVPALLV